MTAVDLDALDKLRDVAAAVLRGHGQADHDPQTGTFDCRCGEWSGGFLSYHQADKVIEHALPDLVAEARKYRELREAVEAVMARANTCRGMVTDRPGEARAYDDAGEWIRRALATVDGEQ